MDDTHRIEALLAAIQEHGNAVVRASAVELVRALLEVHRAGLSAIMDTLAAHGEPGQAVVGSLLTNEAVSRLLLLHGLHPVDLVTRLRQALDRTGPALRARGAAVRLEHAGHDRVQLRLTGDGPEVRALIEQAILEAAPDAPDMEFIDDAHATRRPLPWLR